MLRLKYSYKTIIKFSENIFSHHYLLRCIPRESEALKIIESKCTIFPYDNKTISIDSFGNTIITGYIDNFHNDFEFISEGVVELSEYKIQEPLNPLFLYHSKLTFPSEKILQLSNSLIFTKTSTTQEKAIAISDAINKALKYVPGVTSVQTTAEEALMQGEGVCQDFTHIMIAVCRLQGIAARYVSGFMQGEGFTHAWVEYHHFGTWYAFDPTNNRPVYGEYIKIAHGRDYADCAVDKGVFKGLAQQNLNVSVRVEDATQQFQEQ
jgi:transglutaminase-like putative cysteine protease